MKTKTYALSIAAFLGLCNWVGTAQAQTMTVVLEDPAWDGKTIPDGQQCAEYGGNGSTPLITVQGIPEKANVILVEFNDESYEPLSTDGGHGIVGFDIVVGKGSATLLSIPGDTTTLPNGVWIEEENRDDIGVVGYLPPCSGGEGNLYSAKVFAVDYGSEGHKVLAESYLQLGRY